MSINFVFFSKSFGANGGPRVKYKGTRLERGPGFSPSRPYVKFVLMLILYRGLKHKIYRRATFLGKKDPRAAISSKKSLCGPQFT